MQPTNPRDAVELLEVFRIGLTNKVLDTQCVIDWADAIIGHDAAPDYFVIELALCGSRNSNDMISLLNEYIGKLKPRVAGRAMLGVLYHEYIAGKIDLYRVVRTLDWLATNDQLNEEECRMLCAVDDFYSMAVDGVYGLVATVADYVLCLLVFFLDFRLENVAQWDGINATLSKKMQSLYQQLQGMNL